MRPIHFLLFASLSCSILLIKADFGQEIVDEAVDLFVAQESDDEGDPRSMEGLLHWAISHSDPQKLAAQAEQAQRIQMVMDFKEQRQRVQELLDHVRSLPTETDMMKEGIAILQRPGASDTELLAALQALQVLLEPMDNANDLHALGGIAPVVAQLAGGAQLAAAAAHVLGTASSNNPTFQRQLLSGFPGVVATLLQVSQAAQEECAGKGMYALAALVRNLPEARGAFADAEGFRVLELLLRGTSVGARIKRKALSLFMDLVDTQPAVAAEAKAEGPEADVGSGQGSGADAEAEGGAPRIVTIDLDGGSAATMGSEGSGASTATAGSSAQGSSSGVGVQALAAAAVGNGLPEAVVALLLQPDPDMQEKALLVVQRLAADAVGRQVLRDQGAAEAVLELRQQLHADAPGPGDEPDPYHEYLVGLSDQVAAQMATSHDTSSPSSLPGAGGPNAGPAGAQGQEGPGRARQVGQAEEQEAKQEILALGGPSGGKRGAGRAAAASGEAAAEGRCGTEKGQCSLGGAAS